MRKLLNCCTETLEEVKSMVVNVKEAASDAYENKAVDNGHMTFDRMNIMFQNKWLTLSTSRKGGPRVFAPSRRQVWTEEDGSAQARCFVLVGRHTCRGARVLRRKS
jgi:hypothetical protein